MAEKLTDKAVRDAASPPSGNRIIYDEDVKGFGVRITSAGAKAFILNYRASGRERRLTIGSFPDWGVSAARDEAKKLKRLVDQGQDPMGERHERRAAPTVNDLADRFDEEHLSKRRSATQIDYRSILRLYIRPELGAIKVSDIRHSDIEQLHNRLAKTVPYRANRTVSVLSKMLSLAVKWEMRTDNPARGIERAPEEKRERFLTIAEIARLGDALAAHREKATANALVLLLLTGARRGEMLAARWTEFDLDAGVWLKPSAHTKTKKEHRVPLSGQALTLLTSMRAEAEREKQRGGKAEFVFPGIDGKPLQEIKRSWLSICRTAGLAEQIEKKDARGKVVKGTNGKPLMAWRATVRIHDLRHTYASILASAGLSLPVIGRLLGHTQSSTTLRYAHLLDDPLRAAAEHVGKIVSGAGGPVAQAIPSSEGRPG